MDKSPCTPDCPRRNATCHANCPDYAPYEAAQAAKRAARAKTAAEAQDLRAARRVAINRHYRNKRK